MHRQRHGLDTKLFWWEQWVFVIYVFHLEVTIIRNVLLKGGTARVTISFPEFKLLSFSLFQAQLREQ